MIAYTRHKKMYQTYCQTLLSSLKIWASDNWERDLYHIIQIKKVDLHWKTNVTEKTENWIIKAGWNTYSTNMIDVQRVTLSSFNYIRFLSSYGFFHTQCWKVQLKSAFFTMEKGLK